MSHHREPIKHTCPDIDKYIKEIQWEIVTERDLKHLSEDELLSVASAMSSKLEECIEFLEKLRKSNEALRMWGIEEAENFDELEKQFAETENT